MWRKHMQLPSLHFIHPLAVWADRTECSTWKTSLKSQTELQPNSLACENGYYRKLTARPRCR
jgi:hypothetical protein